MTWFNLAVRVAKTKLAEFFPALGAMEAARDFISEAVAQRIRDQACTKAYELLAQTHRKVMSTIVGQNAVLLLSLVPVYYLHSALPFYVAYFGVACHSLYSIVSCWPLVQKLLKSRSVTQTLSGEVLVAIEDELTQRQFYERKVVEWLGPDLKKLSDDVAKKLRPDVVAAGMNMAITLLLAFVAFRLFAIPLLEHKALLH